MDNSYDSAFGTSNTASASSGAASSYDDAFAAPKPPTATDAAASLPKPIKIPTLGEVKGNMKAASGQLDGLQEMMTALEPGLKTKPDPSDAAAVKMYNGKVSHYNDIFDAYTKLHGLIATPLSPEEVAASDATFQKQAKDNTGTFNIIKNTVLGLPKAAWNFLGVGKIQDYLKTPEGQEAAANLKGSDVAKSIIPSVGKVAATPIADVAGIFTGPKTYHVPVIGDITNIQQQTKDAVLAGENPYKAIIEGVPQSIFDGLFVAGLAEKVVSPREVSIAKGVKVPENTLGDTGNKSFRLTQPVKTTSNPIPNELLTKLTQEGVNLAKYDSSRPSFFKITPMADGTLKGEIVQLKPSLVDVFKSKFGGSIDNVPPEDLTTLYEESKTAQDIKSGLTEPKQSLPPAPLEEPAPPTETSAPKPELSAELESLAQQFRAAPPAAAKSPVIKTQAAAVVGAKEPRANIVTTPSLRTFDFNELEGKPQTAEANAKIHDQIINHPEEPMSPKGESFDAAAKRGLDTVKKIMETPGNKVLTTHNSMFGLIELWDKMGQPAILTKAFREAYTKQDLHHPTGDSYTIKTPNGNIELVRHGETTDNAKKVFRTSSANLTDKGIEEAHALGDNLSGKDITKIYTSDLPRALHTSNIIMDHVEGKETKAPVSSPVKKESKPSVEKPVETGEKKSKSIKVYRGGEGPIDLTRGKNRGISVTTDKSVAETFTAPQNGVVDEASLSPSAKILKESAIPAQLQESYISSAKNLRDNALGMTEAGAERQRAIVIAKQQAIIDYARKNGFDAVEFPFEKEIRVLNPEVLEKETNTEGGFVNPKAMSDSIRKVAEKTKDYIEQSNKAVEFSSALNDTLYKAIKNAEADFIQSDKLLDATKDVPKEARANIDAYRDELGAGIEARELTDEERSINENILDPLARDLEQKRAFIKKYGVSLPSEDTNPRLVKGKGSPIDKLIAEKDKFLKRTAIRPTKNILRKSAPTLKSRTMFALTNKETGARTVVHIEKGQVTEIKDNQPRDLGSTDQIISPRIKEFYDEQVTPALMKLAADLGITHVTEPLKGGKAGVSFSKQGVIKTHPGAPERVLIHEIGHQIDEKYGLQSLIPDTPFYNKQLRAVADLRTEGREPTPSFKSYIRSAPEKMAAMFEAYLHVPDKFEEVAPQLFHTFEMFLGRHPELQPILNLEPSLVLGMKKMGGEHVAGTKGKEFVDKDGVKYTVGEATKDEIENNTSVRYYHDPITAMVFTHQDITQIYRAVQILDAFKKSEQFPSIAFKIGDGIPPEKWKPVNLPQFRDYLFEPHTADVLNAFAMDIKSGEDPVRYLTMANNLLTSTMFMSPVKHLLNVGTSAAINRGLTRWLNPLAYPVAGRAMIQSIRSVVMQDDDYIKILRAGGPMMSAKVNQDLYRANVLANLGEAGDEYAKLFTKGKRIVANVTPWNWAHALTWPGNDMIVQQQLREELAKKGLTVKSATPKQIEDIMRENVLKILPDYRLPIAVRKVPKYVTRNTVLFAAYRFSLLKSFYELGKTVLTGNDADFNGQEAWKNRAKAFDKIAIMALFAAILMPFIDKELKKATGNVNAYLSDPSQLSVIDNINKLFSNRIDPGQYIQTMFDLPPATKEALQQIVNLDFFTGKAIRPNVGPMSAKFGASFAHLETTITPFDLTQKIAGGTMTLKQLLEAQLGIHTPKGNNLLNILAGSNANVLTEIKRLTDAGTPPSSTDIAKRPEMEILKAEVSPEKYQEALNQFTGAYTANIAKLLDGTYVHHSATTFPKKIDYQNLTDAQKAKAFDTVKTDTLKGILQAYGYNKSVGLSGIANFEGNATKLGTPTTSNLSVTHADDGSIDKRNPKGEPYYARFPLAVSDKIRDDLFNSDSYWKDNGYTTLDVQLDHIVPIEAGGTMTKDNLMLISKESDQLNQPFEDFIGEKYKNGTISRADAIRASIDYKIRKTVTFKDIKDGKY